MDYNIAKIRDKLRIFEKTNKSTSTFFLTPSQIEEAKSILKNVSYNIAGGYEDAERNIIIFGDESYQNFIKVIRIETSGGETLNHRSVLGSLLGLGIKREILGDIIVKENICDIIIMQEMEEYIINNFQKVGNFKIKIKKIAFDEMIIPIDEKNILTVTSASLRADGIISTAFGISREKSSILFDIEKVQINYMPCRNSSKQIKEGDIISVRGFGRITINEIVGETKKGRMRLKIEVKK